MTCATTGDHLGESMPASRRHVRTSTRPLALLAGLSLIGAGLAIPAQAAPGAAAGDEVATAGDEAAVAATTAGDPGPVPAEVGSLDLVEIHYAGSDDEDFIEVAAPAGTDASGWVVGSITRGDAPHSDAHVLTLPEDTTVPESGVLDVAVPITNSTSGGYGSSAFVVTSFDSGGEIAGFWTIGERPGGLGTTAGHDARLPEAIRGATASPTGVTGSPTRSIQWLNGEWVAAAPTRGEPNDAGEDDPGEPGDPEELTIAQVWGASNGTTVTTTGVVTGHYPTGGFNGYTVQTAGSGGDGDLDGREVSDALFVYSPSTVDDVGLGDYVRITGTRGEYNGLHQISVDTSTPGHQVAVLDQEFDPVVPIADFVLPHTEAERLVFQNMLVHPASRYVVSDTYQLGGFGDTRFGSIGLGLDGPLVQETDVANPADPGYEAVVADNAARAVALDDGQSTRTPFDAQVPYLTGEPNVRTGVGVTFHEPVIVDYRFQWNFQPTEPVTGNAGDLLTFAGGDTREANAAPAEVGGDVTVAIFNVLNYFTTLGADMPDCTSYDDREGKPLTVNRCTDPDPGPRGAWDAEVLSWQQDKIVAAINALDADVVGLSELENSAHFSSDGNRDETLEILVDALNEGAGEDTWAFAPSPAQVPDLAHDDVIRNAFIYQPEAVEPAGEATILTGQSQDGQPFANAREPLAQPFGVVGTDYEFLAVVNHFKSKGCSGYDGDVDAPQSCYNADRIEQAESLIAFADEVAADAGIEDALLVGDFNAYAAEDPVRVFEAAGYANANPAWNPSEGDFSGDNTYVFDGRVGSLDHIFMSETAQERHTGTEVWSINANESVLAEYSRHNYFASSHFDPGVPFRSSDHDPVIIGLDVPDDEPGELVDLSILSFNDLHGRIGSSADNVGDPAVAASMACFAQNYRDQNANTLLVSAGDNIGATTFTSFIDQDFPTLDVLNELGLDAVALGNHEFDQGRADVDERVIPYSDFPWIAANIVDDAGELVYDPYVIVESGGLDVAFVGAITEDMPNLVTPSGIEELTFTSMSEAVNTQAAELTATGAADVVIAVVHEGLPTTSLDSAEGTAFGQLIDEAHDSISAIISGHTHGRYVHDVDGMWVTQAGQYGEAMGVLNLTIEAATGEVVDSEARNESIDPAGNQECALGQRVRGIVDEARANAAELGEVVIGEATHDFNRARNAGGSENRGGESVLGALVADAQLWAAQRTHPQAQIAFTNSGGLRADLAAGPVTVRDSGDVQPFANTLVSIELSGEQLAQVLEDQWRANGEFSKLAQSANFRYLYDPDAAAGERIGRMLLDGEVVEPQEFYTVVVNSHMAGGGGGMTTLPQGRNIADTGQSDLDAMVDYITAQGTITPDFTQRAVGVRWISDPDAVFGPGEEIALDVSSFVFTAGEPVPQVLHTTLGGVGTGEFDLDPTPVNNTDEAGRAQIRLTVPEGLTGGEHDLEIADETNGTVVTLPVTVAADPGTPTDPLEAVLALQHVLEDYRASGDVDGPIGHQLTNALSQAQRHLEGGRANPAEQALTRFTRHLDNPRRPDTLSPDAAADLRERAVAILEVL
ncbi:ExeM/NucH family extracellular endonuclease [Pseudactinotalea sp. Z1739]|uniref:ExeM/NucH family extracellular endonuclease n=1 Tax=Pseudactinotalea sp. Z1739 TaxID=3413028 RepID=UPI003C79BC11